LTNSPALGAEGFAKGKTGPMGGVEKPITKPQFKGETGPTRTPPQATKGTTFEEITRDPRSPQFKAPESAPVATIDSQNQNIIGKYGSYVNAIIGSRTSAMVAGQSGGGLPGGGFAGPNKGTGGMYAADNGGDSGRKRAQPGATIGQTKARPRTPMKGDF
jgi:hypothetical protein